MSLLSFSAIWAILVSFLAWKRTSDKTIVWATCGFDFSTNLCLRFATNNNLHGLAPDLHQLASTALWTCSNLIESFSFFSFEQSQSHIFSHTVDLNKNKSNFLIVQLANLPWKFLNNLHQLAWSGMECSNKDTVLSQNLHRVAFSFEQGLNLLWMPVLCSNKAKLLIMKPQKLCWFYSECKFNMGVFRGLKNFLSSLTSLPPPSR